MPGIIYTTTQAKRAGTAMKVEAKPCNMKLVINHPDAHLKTFARWVLGWVPPKTPGATGGRTFFASRIQEEKRKSKKKPGQFVTIRRYWGYVTYDGERRYGWIEQTNVRRTSQKWKKSQKPKPYASYARDVRRTMKVAWRYRVKKESWQGKETAADKAQSAYDRGHAVNARPVRALLKAPPSQLTLPIFRNPWHGTTPAIPDPPVERNHPEGFVIAVRWAMNGWILAHTGAQNDDWAFVKGDPDDLVINPTIAANEKLAAKDPSKLTDEQRAQLDDYAYYKRRRIQKLAGAALRAKAPA